MLKILILGSIILAIFLVTFYFLNQNKNISSSNYFAFDIKFKMPTDFSIKNIEAKTIIQLIEPEQKLDIFVGKVFGTDTFAEINNLIFKIDPNFKENIKLKINPPLATEEWDEVISIIYEQADTNQFASASGYRFENNIFVVFIRGPINVYAKRAAQIQTFLACIKGRENKSIKNTELDSIRNHLQEFDEFINFLLQHSQIPGLSIAIVENGKTVLCKGYGVTDLESQTPMSEQTQMCIGSTSKAFTTLLMAKLIEEKKFNWKTKVLEVYPFFELGDPYLTASLTMEDIVSASTGIPRKDLPIIFLKDDLSREELLFKNLKILYPTTKHGETFQYSNFLLTAAGYFSAYADDPSKSMPDHFEELITQKIFEPLKMSRSSFTPLDENFAARHNLDLMKNCEMAKIANEPDNFLQYAAPAGGIWSCADDMGKYLEFELNSESKNVLHRRNSVVSFGTMNYCLGLMSREFYGVQAFSHGGNTIGFSSEMLFIPEKNIGISILTNTMGSNVYFDIIINKLFELWFGIASNSEARILYQNDLLKTVSKELQSKVLEDQSALQNILGTFFNEELGKLNFVEINEKYFLEKWNKLWPIILIKESNKHQISFLDPSMAWLLMEIMPNNSLLIREAQHEYLFIKEE